MLTQILVTGVVKGKEFTQRGLFWLSTSGSVKLTKSSPPPQLVKARNTLIRDYNGKSRHHHQETIISVEITIRKTSLMSHLKDKIAPYFKYYLIIIYNIKIYVRRAAGREYSYFYFYMCICVWVCVTPSCKMKNDTDQKFCTLTSLVNI